MVAALRQLFSGREQPTQESKESAVHAIATIIDAAKVIGHAHASDELERAAWGGNFSNVLSSAWGIVNTFVQRIADWIDGQDVEDLTDEAIQDQVDSLAETVGDTEVASAIEGEVMEQLTAQGYTQQVWYADPEACPTCIENAEASPLPMGSEWPSGDTSPPAHPHCHCSIGTPASGGA